MDDSEFMVDFGIQGANLINFNQMPHKVNKNVFILQIQKIQDASSLFKGRFDFNLFTPLKYPTRNFGCFWFV